MKERLVLLMKVVFLIGFVASDALNLEAQEAKPPSPIVLEVTRTEEVKMSEGPMGSAYYSIVSTARFEIEMNRNPLTGRIGAAACTGYEVVLSEIKEGKPFCFRLRYIDGRVAHAEGISGRDKAVFKEVPEENRVWTTVADGAVMSRNDGRIEIKVYTPSPVADNNAAEEAMSCGSLLEPELTITYAELRNLQSLSKKWESSKFASPEDAESIGCKGKIIVEIRATGKEPGRL
ncbi:MAG: hypothetical protein AB1715_04780 [Acidobacteriota bacterium]